jgi:hypothetical protein
MIRTLVIATLVVVSAGCKKPPRSEDTAGASGSNAGGSGQAPPAADPGPGSSAGSNAGAGSAPSPSASASWTIESHPVEPRCGDRPLELPPPVAPTEPAVDTKLATRAAIASCHDQPSVAATCSCLASSIESWGKEALSPKGECEAGTTELDANAALVRVKSVPADPNRRAAGQATIFVAKRGAAWSAVAAVAIAADVDQGETPDGSEKVVIDHTEHQSIDGGTLYWIEARNEAQDKALGGKLAVTGSTEGTICRVTTGDASCLGPVVLGAWSYGGSCKVHTLGAFRATVTPKTVTVRIEHGKQSEAIVGVYHM